MVARNSALAWNSEERKKPQSSLLTHFAKISASRIDYRRGSEDLQLKHFSKKYAA